MPRLLTKEQTHWATFDVVKRALSDLMDNPKLTSRVVGITDRKGNPVTLKISRVFQRDYRA